MYKKLSRFAVLFSIISNIISPCCIAHASDTAVDSILFEDFEGDTTSYINNNTEIYTFENDCILNKTLHIKNNSEASVFPFAKVGFSKIYIDDSVRAGAREGENCYTEIEFDVKPYNMDTYSKHLYIDFYDSSNNSIKRLVFNARNGNIYADSINGDILGHTGVDNEIFRIRIVLKITNADASTIDKCISALYVNGENILTENAAFEGGETLAGIKFEMSAVKSDDPSDISYGAYIDNFNVMKYNSADGSSPYTEKYSLVKKVRNYQSSEDVTKPELLNEALSNAIAVIKNVSAGQKDVQKASDILDLAYKNALGNSEQTMFYDNFTMGEIDGNISESSGLNDLISIDKSAFSDDVFLGNVLKFNGTSSAYAAMNLNFGDILLKDVAETGMQTVTEFDIISNGLSEAKANLTLKLSDATTKKIFAKLFFNIAGKKIHWGESTSAEVIGTFNGFSERTRVRIVIDITDENGEAVNAISQILINGQNKLTAPVSLLETDYTSYNKLQFAQSKKTVTSEYGIYVDNLSVSYGTSVSDRYALVNAVQKIDSALNGEWADTYNEIEKTQLENLKSEAIDAFDAIFTSNESIADIVGRTEYLINKDSVTLGSINVEGKNGISHHYITGGTLKSITLNKRREAGRKLRLITAVYDSDGALASCALNDVDTGFDASQDIEVGLELDDNVREGRVSIMLWDENNLPFDDMFKTQNGNETISSVSMNNLDCIMEAPPTFESDGNLYVSAKYTANLFGLNCYEENGVYTAKDDYGNTLTFNENTAMVNGKTYMVIVNNGIIMIPSAVFEENFGCTVDANEMDNTMTMSAGSEITKSYPAPPAEMFEYSAEEYSISYAVNYDNPDAEVEVYYKDKLWRPKNYLSLYYNKAHNPIYSDGKFYGGIASLQPNRAYSFRIKITDGSNVLIYDTPSCKTLSADTAPTIEEFLYDTDEELLLKPTYENIGYYIDATDAAECKVTYRKTDESTWQEAYEPAYDGIQFRGSITGLNDNTQYEVKAVIYDSNGKIKKTKTALTKTQNNNPNIAQTIKLSEIYTGGGLMISNLNGSADAWIKVVNDASMTINGEKNHTEAVLIDNCSYVIIEGLTVEGGYRYGINVSDNCSNIRISNCDISKWGRAGILNETEGVYYCDGSNVNYDAGICMKNADNVTVERCYIHNSNAYTNSWNSDLWRDVHPQGGCGIHYSTDSAAVIRYNDIIGNSTHRWNDAIEGFNNNSRMGAASRNCDIYGNMLYMGEDDGMELEGGQMNVRVYNNRIEKFLVGISSTPNMAGPAYIFGNLITNLGSSYKNHTNSAVKIGGSTDGVFGMHYFFNNTIDSMANAINNSAYSGTSEYHSVSRNNIFVTRGTGKYAFRNIYANELDDNDYDLTYGIVSLPDSSQTNGISEAPVYEDALSGNYRLAKNSPGKNAGTYTANFGGGSKSDIGAFANCNENEFLPMRPAGIYADKYRVNVNDGEKAVITVTVDGISENIGYSILTDNSWIKPEETEGSAINGSTFDVSFTAKLSDADTDTNGMLLIRLDNGYSIPITVTCTK